MLNVKMSERHFSRQGLMFEHGIENRKQFSHAGGQGELLRLAAPREPLVEGPRSRGVVSCRGQGRHG